MTDELAVPILVPRHICQDSASN